MKNEHDNIDKLIHQALQTDDQQFASESSELGLIDAMTASFKGRSRWLVAMVFVFIFIYFGLLIFSGYQFFQAETAKTQIMWATGFLFCTHAVLGFKQWYWMELQKNAVTRELKRLELQVAQFRSELKK